MSTPADNMDTVPFEIIERALEILKSAKKKTEVINKLPVLSRMLNK
jgi:hypothetical protein